MRAERDRLNLLIDSVADPIIVTDQEGEISLMNNPAERLFTVVPGAGEDAQRIVRANDAHFTSFVSGLLSTGRETTRRGEIALVDPNTGKAVPVEALAAKMLSDLGELTAIVTILHDRTEAIERVQLYEQLKRRRKNSKARCGRPRPSWRGRTSCCGARRWSWSRHRPPSRSSSRTCRTNCARR